MAVLGILITGIVTLINPVTQLRRARDAERKNTLFQLRSALELHYNDRNEYPVTPGFFSSEPGDNVTNNGGNWIPGLVPNYIQRLPRDPEGGPGDPALNPGCSSWRRAYLYRSDGQNYAILAHCSPLPGTWDSDYGLFDPIRPSHAWKVCAGDGCNW